MNAIFQFMNIVNSKVIREVQTRFNIFSDLTIFDLVCVCNVHGYHGCSWPSCCSMYIFIIVFIIQSSIEF